MSRHINPRSDRRTNGLLRGGKGTLNTPVASELLKRAGVFGAAAAVPTVLKPDAARAEAELAELRQMKTLSPGEARTIAAVCDRLIPSDATGPGAKEANVARYIDRALAGDLRPFRLAYTAAINALDGYSLAKHGATFAALPPTGRTRC